MPGLSLIFGLSIVGTGAWVVAVIAAAIALRRAGASLGPFVLLILSGVFLMGGFCNIQQHRETGVGGLWLKKVAGSSPVGHPLRKPQLINATVGHNAVPFTLVHQRR